MNVLFIDSGIGGLTTLATCVKQTPNLNFIYFADNKYAPYGSLTSLDITRRLITIINSQLKYNIGIIVLACNTATANSIDILRRLYNIPIVGIEPAIKPAYGINNKILVLATPATTKHSRFAKLVSACPCSIEIVPMQNLAKQIDNYYLYKNKKNKADLQKTINYIIKISKNKTHIVLGCTHYVFLKNSLSKLIHSTILDGNLGLSKQLLTKLSIKFLSKNPTQKFVLSNQNSDLCKKYRKIFEQTLANITNVW